jgi:hypothetical protein
MRAIGRILSHHDGIFTQFDESARDVRAAVAERHTHARIGREIPKGRPHVALGVGTWSEQFACAGALSCVQCCTARERSRCYIRAAQTGRSCASTSLTSSRTSERISCPVSLKRIKTMRYLVLGVCVFATACAGEIPGSPTSPTIATVGGFAETQARGGSQLPFHGSLQAVETDVVASPFLQVNGTGTGTGTQLGRFTPTFTATVTLATGSATGSIRLIAANGDRLDATFIGQGTPTTEPGVVSIEEVATGYRRYGSIRRDYRRIHHPARAHSGDGCVLRVV